MHIKFAAGELASFPQINGKLFQFSALCKIWLPSTSLQLLA